MLRALRGKFLLLAIALVIPALAPTPLLAEEDDGLAALVELLGQSDEAEFQLDLLKGMRAGLQGRKRLEPPPGWTVVATKLAKSKNDDVREQARLLALDFGDPAALAALRKTLLDPKAAADERRAALEALVEKRVADLAPALQKLVADPAVRAAAVRGLAAYDDPGTPKLLVASYVKFSLAEKQDAISTLVARPDYADKLLDAIEAKQIPRDDVTAFTARQLLGLGDKDLSARLEKVWGAVRQSTDEKKALIAKIKQQLTPATLAKANVSAGRAIFARTCQQCHKLYGEGAAIGPDLTGSNRANLDYVLENAIDPSAVIGRDYRLTNVLTTDGRLVSGVVKEETEQAVVLQTVNARVVLSKEDIEEMAPSPVSMMPENQLEKLKAEEVRDLVAYLATKDQAPLPPGFKLEPAASE